jgi:hypothetical protein
MKEILVTRKRRSLVRFFMKSRPGAALLVAVSLLAIMLVLTFGGIFFLSDWVNVMKLRTARVNQVGAEMTDVALNQIHLYAVRVHDFFRQKTDEAKAAANARWFSRAELDAKNTYTYEEVREKFKTIGFDSVDRALTGLARIKRFDFSIPEEGRTYDENDFLVVCQVLLEIEMEDGAWLLPLWETGWRKEQKGAKNLELQMGVSKIWRKNGIAIAIPMQIEGDGKNFWVDGWVDGLPRLEK